MPEPQPERRSSRRFALTLPLTVSFAGEAGNNGDSRNAIASQSLDVSARGICFYFDTPPANGTDLEFTLTLPTEITAADSIHVRCKGRVVRAEKSLPTGRMSVAAVINEYEFLPET